MATGTGCGPVRIQPVSCASHAATGQGRRAGSGRLRPGAGFRAWPGMTRDAADARRRRMTVTERTLPAPETGPDDTGQVWEQALPGTAEQIRHVRAALRPLLQDCPAADDIILLVSKLFFPRFESVSPKVHPRNISHLSAGSFCRQRRPSSLRISARQVTEADLRAHRQQATQARGEHIQAAGRQQ